MSLQQHPQHQQTVATACIFELQEGRYLCLEKSALIGFVKAACCAAAAHFPLQQLHEQIAAAVAVATNEVEELTGDLTLLEVKMQQHQDHKVLLSPMCQYQQETCASVSHCYCCCCSLPCCRRGPCHLLGVAEAVVALGVVAAAARAVAKAGVVVAGAAAAAAAATAAGSVEFSAASGGAGIAVAAVVDDPAGFASAASIAAGVVVESDVDVAVAVPRAR